MIRKNIKERREPRVRMSQRDLNDDIEIGDVITTDEGLRIKCVGITSNGEPIFDKCRF